MFVIYALAAYGERGTVRVTPSRLVPARFSFSGHASRRVKVPAPAAPVKLCGAH